MLLRWVQGSQRRGQSIHYRHVDDFPAPLQQGLSRMVAFSESPKQCLNLWDCLSPLSPFVLPQHVQDLTIKLCATLLSTEKAEATAAKLARKKSQDWPKVRTLQHCVFLILFQFRPLAIQHTYIYLDPSCALCLATGETAGVMLHRHYHATAPREGTGMGGACSGGLCCSKPCTHG